ncbi:hypothetical protein [Endozoicomonas sp. GU-1]|uniref:hypothetical protein n=1 Tax=Endozoicomonas sp. GU-1 TaxID=3009078 RepID=UPI0022B4DD41|nr:hypothetical protein [Endozoicomonas sp. GU-1]WBA87870.1 hypothetical protein O3276_07645 [Endozoicomonas sp. GU-1]
MRREISDEEILDRLTLALINEGFNILEEGIAQRSSDIDVVYIFGYGFPAYRGGPMALAENRGLKKSMPEFASLANSSASRTGHPLHC